MMPLDNGHLVFSVFVEKFIGTVETSNQQLEQLARLRSDDILSGFYRSLEKSYHQSKLIEIFLRHICSLENESEAKGFNMAVNGFDTSFRSVLFLEIMRQFTLTGLQDETLDSDLSLRIAIEGQSNADAIMNGYAICIALSEVKRAAKDLDIFIQEPSVQVKSFKEENEAVPNRDEIEDDEVSEDTEETKGTEKLSHKQQILLLERIGFY